jgi:glycosyltransferase involved in cell wall biosynthesis
MVGDIAIPQPRDLRHPLVAILMCTFNGEQFLHEQLASIATQTHPNWVLWVSDDGSSDSTLDILRRTQHSWGAERLTIVQGPCKGFARNFLSLACNPQIEAEYYAFSDQDDVWLPRKLTRAVEWFFEQKQSQAQHQTNNIALLYGSRTSLIDESGHPIGISKLIPNELSFSNALVQNVAGGNTMVFNYALVKTLRDAGAELDIVSHDWWLYIVATATGGKVLFDQEPHILYRQHKGNLVGSNLGFTSRFKCLQQLFSSRFADWIQQNHRCFKKLEAHMTIDSIQRAQILASVHQVWLYKRLCYFIQSGTRRQSVTGNIELSAAVVSDRV